MSDAALDAHRALIEQLASPQICPVQGRHALSGVGRGHRRCEVCLGTGRVLWPRTCAGCSGVLRPRVGEPLSVYARRSACNRRCGALSRPAPLERIRPAPSHNGNGSSATLSLEKPETLLPRLSLTKTCAGCPVAFGPYSHESVSHFRQRRYCSKACYRRSRDVQKIKTRDAAVALLPLCRACQKPVDGRVKSGLHLECRGTERAFPLHFPGADLERIDQAPASCQRCGCAGLQVVDEGLVCRVCGKRVRIVECLAALARRGVGRA
jgi:hypothetical protein